MIIEREDLPHNDIDRFANFSQPRRVEFLTRLLNEGNSLSEKSTLLNEMAHEDKTFLRDIAMTIRARGVEEEQSLLGSDLESCFLFDSYGIVVVPGQKTAEFDFQGSIVDSPDTRIIVSTPTWQQARKDLASMRFGSSTVILPETITIAGELSADDLRDRDYVKEITENNLAQLCELSRHLSPETMFVVGSPYFVEGSDRPFNCALHIKDGRIEGMAFKHNGVAQERAHFSFPSEREISLIEDSSVLICKDMLTLCHSLSVKPDRITRSHPKKFADPSGFINEDTKELLVPSCWGVGAENQRLGSQNQRKIDRTYATTLSVTVADVFTRRPQLERIIVSDRTAAFFKASPTNPIGSHPLSMVAFNPIRTQRPLC